MKSLNPHGEILTWMDEMYALATIPSWHNLHGVQVPLSVVDERVVVKNMSYMCRG